MTRPEDIRIQVEKMLAKKGETYSRVTVSAVTCDEEKNRFIQKYKDTCDLYWFYEKNPEWNPTVMVAVEH